MSDNGILTVTLNPALDLTYRLTRLTRHLTNRVEEVSIRGGGKGVNVARLLHTLGNPVVATGLLGGETGRAIHRDLAEAGVADAMVEVSGDSRRTVTLVEGNGLPTVLSEPGPQLTKNDWQGFLDVFPGLVKGFSVVVMSGSLPPGIPVDAYPTLINLARGNGAVTVLDSSGEALREGLGARPDVVKPNHHELADVAGPIAVDGDPGSRTPRLAWVAKAVADLRDRYAGTAMVVSMGALGVFASTPEGAWSASPPSEVRGNPTGAGDAMVAGLAAGALKGMSWPQQLMDAVALSTAATHAPVAGDLDLAVYREYRTLVRVIREDPKNPTWVRSGQIGAVP